MALYKFHNIIIIINSTPFPSGIQGQFNTVGPQSIKIAYYVNVVIQFHHTFDWL